WPRGGAHAQVRGPKGGEMRRSRVRWLALFTVLALAAAACGDDDSGSGAQGGGDDTEAPTTGDASETPRAGGVLRIGVVTAVNSVDPIITSGNGSTGGNELGAIYDRLLEWNPETADYEPKTAESVTPNADFTQWTIKL